MVMANMCIGLIAGSIHVATTVEFIFFPTRHSIWLGRIEHRISETSDTPLVVVVVPLKGNL